MYKKLIVLTCLFLFSSVLESKICISVRSYQKAFASSWRFDFLQRAQNMALIDEKIKDYYTFSSLTDEEFIRKIQESIDYKKCSIILGIYSSKECLIAGAIAEKNNVIILSPGCAHNDIEKYHPYIYTAVPSLKTWNIKAAEKIFNNSQKNIFVFYQPTDVFSKENFDFYQQNYSNKFIPVAIDSEGNLPKEILNIFKNQTSHTFVFTTYPLVSAKVILKLDSYELVKKNTDIFGCSAWAMDQTLLVQIKKTLKKADHVWIPSLINWDNISNNQFYNNYVKQFHEEPLTIHFLTYDIARLGIQCSINSKNFSDCFTLKEYSGASGSMKFSKNNPFAVRKIYFIDFKKRI